MTHTIDTAIKDLAQTIFNEFEPKSAKNAVNIIDQLQIEDEVFDAVLDLVRNQRLIIPPTQAQRLSAIYDICKGPFPLDANDCFRIKGLALEETHDRV